MVSAHYYLPSHFLAWMLNLFHAEWVITATSHAVDEVQEDDLPRDFLNHPVIREQITEASSQPNFAACIATIITNHCVDAYERKRTGEEQNSESSSSNSHGGSEKRTRSIRQIFSDTVNNIVRSTYFLQIRRNLTNVCLGEKGEEVISEGS